jgi:flagellar biosynthesis chaperone FliJ
MGQHDGFDPGATPPSPPPDETTPLHIHEATTPPVFADAPMSEPVVEPTAVMPVQPAAPIRTVPPVAYAPVDPSYNERRVIDDQRRGVWLFVTAVLALLIGGLVGFLIADAADDDDEQVAPLAPVSVPADGSDVTATFDMLLARTRADGEYRTPSEYPQLDEITEIDAAAATEDLENQVAMLTVAQEEAAGLTDQVAQLEQALADTTAERDELAAQLAEAEGTDPDTQAQLDAANEQIATLEGDLEAARTELDAANAALQQAQADLDEANARLEDLNVIAVPNYVNGDVAGARSDAAANGWTLIEQSTESDAAPGTVLEQAPAANSNMVEGSVLYITVAANI